MTELEKQKQLEHEETMRRLRAEFAQAWPAIWKAVHESDPRVILPPVQHAAWLAFRAGKASKP